MKMKHIIAVLCFCIVICTSVFAASFSDISSEHWAFNYVDELTTKGVINGYPDGTFKPDGTISKAEFIKLVVMASLPEEVDIADAPSAMDNWAGQVVAVAQIYQLIEPGSVTESNMNEPITRMEMALIISKADVFLRGNSLDLSKSTTFNDYDEMNKEEITYLTHAVSKGLISGYPDNTFKPSQNMSRAEAATMISRYTK